MPSVEDYGFRESGLRLWNAIHNSRNVGAEYVSLIAHACHLADRLDAIVEELDGANLRVPVFDKQGMQINEVANPLLAEHRQQITAFKVILASLGVEKLPVVQADKPTVAEALRAARKRREANGNE